MKETGAVPVESESVKNSDGLFRAPSSKGNCSACTFQPEVWPADETTSLKTCSFINVWH